jgi:hypothetical protein
VFDYCGEISTIIFGGEFFEITYNCGELFVIKYLAINFLTVSFGFGELILY